MTKILYDGWPLVHQPNSPAALHLLTLLAAHPAEFPAWVGLPGEPFHPLPSGVETVLRPAPDSDWGRLGWEQRLLPALAGWVDAGLVHLVGCAPALFGSRRTLFSPADFFGIGLPATPRRPGFASRLRESLALGGLARAGAWLWPADLPLGQVGIPMHRLPPVNRLPPIVPPDFRPASETPGLAAIVERLRKDIDLPETYLLAHLPVDEPALRRLLDAWSWAAGSIGADYPLVITDLDRVSQDRLAALLAEYQLTGTALPLPPLSLPDLAAVYQGCSALFHPIQPSSWGDPVRLALACGKPVVGLGGEHMAALVGPAGYLVPGDEAYPALCRALGAALITVVVEESLSEVLAEAAQRQASAWQWGSFVDGLRECYAAFAV
jgi:glycosyltransferase involved in cell wall biosynthesis